MKTHTQMNYIVGQKLNKVEYLLLLGVYGVCYSCGYLTGIFKFLFNKNRES